MRKKLEVEKQFEKNSRPKSARLSRSELNELAQYRLNKLNYEPKTRTKKDSVKHCHKLYSKGMDYLRSKEKIANTARMKKIEQSLREEECFFKPKINKRRARTAEKLNFLDRMSVFDLEKQKHIKNAENEIYSFDFKPKLNLKTKSIHRRKKMVQRGVELQNESNLRASKDYIDTELRNIKREEKKTRKYHESPIQYDKQTKKNVKPFRRSTVVHN